MDTATRVMSSPRRPTAAAAEATRSVIRWMFSAMLVERSAMDVKLIAWARAVKARRRRIRPFVPPLWVCTDAVRLPDPRLLLAGLPKGLFGVVFRPGTVADPEVAAGLARICRERRFALVVAGDPRVAVRLHAGRHLSRGWQHRPRGFSPGRGLLTASAHGRRELVRARRLAVDAVFLSPVFATASHPGAAALGVTRWAAMAQGQTGMLVLGGITGTTVRRLPRLCAGAGMIGAASGLALGGAAG